MLDLLRDFFDQILFSYRTFDFYLYQLIAIVLVVLVAMGLFRLLGLWLLPNYYNAEENKKDRRRITRILFYALSLGVLILSLFILELDYALFEFRGLYVRISNLLEVFLFIQIARLIEWLMTKIFLDFYFQKRATGEGEDKKVLSSELEAEQKRAVMIFRYVVYFALFIFILKSFDFDFAVYSQDNYSFRISNILKAILAILVARLIIWLATHVVLLGYYSRAKVDIGTQHAINQLLKYVIYVFAVLAALQYLGFQLTVVLGGIAALLVGVGLGLQQTFNDLASGIILLFERSVEVGDVVQLEGTVGRVTNIGLRTSVVETRDNIALIVPNSKLIVENVTNWSNVDDKVRFKIAVGVAYGSDVELVKKLLIQVAKDNIYVLNHPLPMVRFINFGESSLDFELFFWSRNFLIIEDIKSDMRFEIYRVFNENNISIPFPQRDVWQRKAE